MAPVVVVRDGLAQTASSVPASGSQTIMILGVLVPFLLVISVIPVIMFKRHLDTRSISHTRCANSERCVVLLAESLDTPSEALGKQSNVVEDEINVAIAVDEAVLKDSALLDVTNAAIGELTTVIPSVSLSSLASMICDVSTYENSKLPPNTTPYANGVSQETSSPEPLDVTDEDRLTSQLVVAGQSPVAITISISPSSTRELAYLLDSPTSSTQAESLSYLDPFQDMNVEGLIQAFAASFASSVYYARDSVLSYSFAIGAFDSLIDYDLTKALLSSTPTSLDVSETVDPTGSSLTVNSCTSTQQGVVHSVATFRSEQSSRPSLQILRTRPLSNSHRETLGELWDEDDEKLFGVTPGDRFMCKSKLSIQKFAGVSHGQLWDAEDDEIFSVSSHSPVIGSPMFIPLPLLDFQTDNLHSQPNSGNSEMNLIRTWTEDALSFFGGRNIELGSHYRPTVMPSQGSPLSDSSRSSSSSSSEASLISLPVHDSEYLISQTDNNILLQSYHNSSSARSSLMSLASVLSSRAEWSFDLGCASVDSDSLYHPGVLGDASVLGFVCLTCCSFVDKESVARSSPDENTLQTSRFSSLTSPRVSAKEWKQEQLTTPLISGVSDELSAINLRHSDISSPSFSSLCRPFPFDKGRERNGSAHTEQRSDFSLLGLPVYQPYNSTLKYTLHQDQQYSQSHVLSTAGSRIPRAARYQPVLPLLYSFSESTSFTQY